MAVHRLPSVAFFAAWLLAATAARAQVPLIDNLGGPNGFGSQCMPPDDDGSFPQDGADGTNGMDISAAFPNGLHFFAATFTRLWINNNGNVSFRGAISSFTPSAFPVASEPMIAPYWADVDTRSGSTCSSGSYPGGGGWPPGDTCHDPSDDGVWWNVTPGQMVVTWDRVGYYGCQTDHRMAFQLILSAPSGLAPGDFDVEFRYNRCEWTTGGASGGMDGLGGTPAQAGFDAGDGSNFYVIPGSLTMDILNVCRTSNIDQPGRWLFQIRNGQVAPCDAPGVVCMPADSEPDACIGYQCQGNNPLLLEGGAGPIGCACRIRMPTRAPGGIAEAMIAGLFFATRRPRRRATPRSAHPAAMPSTSDMP